MDETGQAHRAGLRSGRRPGAGQPAGRAVRVPVPILTPLVPA